MWNETVAIINNPKTPADVADYGKMILSQYNTAGGSIIMRSSLESFCEEHKDLIQSLWIVHNGVEMRVQRTGKTMFVFYDMPNDRGRLDWLKKHKVKEVYFSIEPEKFIYKSLVD